jgi:hypothetical protein
VSARLLELFTCERLREQFPRGMSRRACVRRQLEHRKDGKGWTPAHPACAVDCPQSRETLDAVFGVVASTCAKCGAAVIATDACPTCAEKRSVHQVQPREVPRAPAQDRLWSGEVPDVPIGGPPAALGARPRVPFSFGTSPALLELAAKRARAEAARVGHPETAGAQREEHALDEPAERAPEVVHPSPARLAPADHQPQETAMPCKECKSPTRHKLTCSKSPERQKPPARAVPPVPPPPPGATRGPAKTVKRAAVDVRPLPPVEELPDDYVLAAVAEGKRRAARIREEAIAARAEAERRAQRFESAFAPAGAEAAA